MGSPGHPQSNTGEFNNSQCSLEMGLLHSRRKLARACPPPEGHRKRKFFPQRIRYTAANKESYLVACNVFGVRRPAIANLRSEEEEE